MPADDDMSKMRLLLNEEPVVRRKLGGEAILKSYVPPEEGAGGSVMLTLNARKTQTGSAGILSSGFVSSLTGGSKKEGRATCSAMLSLCNQEAVELSIDGGSTITVQAGKPPIVNGTTEERMRVGCGSATIGMFAAQWKGLVDEVVIVDDHITGVVSEHQAGKVIDWQETGIRIKG